MSPFEPRHIGPTSDDIAHMCEVVGVSSVAELIDRTVPAAIRDADLDLPPAVDERVATAELTAHASENEVTTSLVGLGYHGTITPPVIRRRILESPAWYTAYTPYQPEISQGRLEMLVNFQTMVSDLVGMPITNASLLDEGTAAAEAMTLLHRQSRGRRGDRFLVDSACHPQTIEVVSGRAEPLGLEVVVGDPVDVASGSYFGVLVQYPGTAGDLAPLGPVVEAAHGAGALVAVATDLLACTLVEPPGDAGADVVVGSSQRFGVPMGFGGPHAAFMAVRDDAKRSLPGRLVGASIDTKGRTAYRLALATREQHIRREKATSNICTAQVLLAVIAAAYAQYHGPDGLTAIARRVHGAAARVAEGLAAAGHEVVHEAFFDTVCVRPVGGADALIAAAISHGFDLRRVDDDTVALTFDETTDEPTLARLAEALDLDIPSAAGPAIPTALERRSEFLTHPNFNQHHSETEMLRYLRSLSDKDVALDRAMIPLGSCTMKLNAAVAMEPISWPAFAEIHPFGPAERAGGYAALAADLERWLAEITGYDAVSLQPNSGAQGEFAGLLAIRAYHASRGDERDVCLIPASAHGTNPASAAMAGMRVVVVKTDEDGNVDLGDLRSKLDEHGPSVAALMITYPSTHGVFEEAVTEICELVHDAGGQVYLDGANLNAMVGIARPGRFGADVSHLNLHKTFTIPHGGGGPGVGPIGVRSHLAPFLPGRGVVPPVASAPLGSAGILPIPWMYIRMMGADGLRRASEVAILSANYVAARLDGIYPVLYKGREGFVAHECIIDLRAITAETGVTVDDVAKRLIDYGFHAPTMSFPVAGTLMIEPTESESLDELDRFCEAMIAIRAEIEAIAAGSVALEASALRHAPHPAEDLLVASWDRPYTREEAAYPVPALRGDKYWPPVSRIDQGYGDRHLVCTCPPIEAYE